MTMKRHLFWMLAATITFCGSLSAFGQSQRAGDPASGTEAGEQFSIATLNVDGLPQKLLVIKLNTDGPGSSGTARIGKYLLKKGYDLVMMQEDFNYHDMLTVLLEDDYRFDEWSGDLGIEGRSIDFLHLQNHRFPCDGLMGCWKNDLTVTPAGRTAWQQNFGKFSHANDEMVTKGFRRYDVTLRGGDRIVVYNMHMDATLDEDEAEDNAEKDRIARLAQWNQLKEEVLKNLDSRPVIVTGDLNSYYSRDDIKTNFIDAINDSGRGTVKDVWVELQLQGVYPTTSREGESLDKIIYINPAMGTKIKAVAYSMDVEGYLNDGKPLGDHYPVAATFQVESRGTTTGIETVNGQQSTVNGDQSIYTIEGIRVSDQPTQKGVYIQNGKKTIIR